MFVAPSIPPGGEFFYTKYYLKSLPLGGVGGGLFILFDCENTKNIWKMILFPFIFLTFAIKFQFSVQSWVFSVLL